LCAEVLRYGALCGRDRKKALASLLTLAICVVFLLVCDVLYSIIGIGVFLNVEATGDFGEVKLRHQCHQDQSSFELAGMELRLQFQDVSDLQVIKVPSGSRTISRIWMV
jgi:hypothetical protein